MKVYMQEFHNNPGSKIEKHFLVGIRGIDMEHVYTKIGFFFSTIYFKPFRAMKNDKSK